MLWPSCGFTKRDLVDYYLAVAPVLLPHLAGRAVTLARFPDGVDGPGWFQSNCPPGRPAWIPTADVVGARGQPLRYCRVESEAALAWVANTAAIELHPFLARYDRPRVPCALVLDLDPEPPAALLDCCRIALALRPLLPAGGRTAVVKTSGSRGLHVWVPLEGDAHTFDETSGFARAVAETLASRDPARVAARLARAGRAGKVLIDWRQNAAGLSLAAPYSLRATPVPRVSAPVSWHEVASAAARGDASALALGPAEVLARVASRGDLFAPALGSAPTTRSDAP